MNAPTALDLAALQLTSAYLMRDATRKAECPCRRGEIDAKASRIVGASSCRQCAEDYIEWKNAPIPQGEGYPAI